MVTWEPGKHYGVIDSVRSVYFTSEKGKRREVRVGYSLEKKDTRKTRQNHYQIYSFNSICIHSNRYSLRACCMPGTVLDTKKYKDEYNIVLELFTILLGKIDMNNKVIIS